MTIPELTWSLGGRFALNAYLALGLMGALATLLCLARLAKRRGLDRRVVLYGALWCFAAGLIGARLLGLLIHFDRLIDFFRTVGTVSSAADLGDRLAPVFGDAVFYGGLILALAALWLFVRRAGPERAAYFDLAAVGIPLFHGFGRLGCFLTGCCWGVPWKYGFAYAAPQSTAPAGVPLVPVQLVEAILNYLLFFLLRRLFLRGKGRGKLLLLYLLIYPSYRFLLEFFRGDRVRGFAGPLSTSQWISLALIAVSACSWLLSLRKKPEEKLE